MDLETRVSKIGKVDTSELYEQFEHHLNQWGNEKILFSAKYGSGKSTFLRDFFAEQPNYYTISISPVHYVTNESSDIFELIKVDILRNLYINNDLDITPESQSIQLNTLITEGIRRNPIQLVHIVSKLLATLTSSPSALVATSVSSSVDSLIKHLKKIEDEMGSQTDKPDTYLSTYYNEPGTFIEFNVISQLIVKTLKAIKLRNIKTILIIDDVDRLDPYHVFRILNVFSAHYEEDKYDGHKLGFDKAIVVADYQNLKSIFHHRYGSQTDFKGYIEKFFSYEVYHFDFKAYIATKIVSLNIELNNEADFLLTSILEYFVKAGVLNIRQLSKLNDIDFQVSDFIIHREFTSSWPDVIKKELVKKGIKENEIRVFSRSFGEIKVLQILSKLFGSWSELKLALMAPIPPKYSGLSNQAIVKLNASLVLLDHFINKIRNRAQVYDLHLSLLSEKYGSSYYSYPHHTVLGHEFKVQTKWGSHCNYKSEECYFRDVLIEPTNNKLRTISSLQQIVKLLAEHASFLEAEQWFFKLNISSYTSNLN